MNGSSRISISPDRLSHSEAPRNFMKTQPAKILRYFIALALLPVAVPCFASIYQLDLHLHSIEMIPEEASAGDVLLPVVAAAKGSRPVNSQFNFIGVAAGQPIWRLPRSQNPNLLFLSIGTEELSSADFASPISWNLIGVTGTGNGPAPGYFSMWGVDDFGGVIPLMSTAPSALTPNTLDVNAAGHYHFNYAFTAPGLYNVEFQATATLSSALGGGQVTGSAVYSFGVFDTGADYVAPESGPFVYEGMSFPVVLYGNEHIDMGIGLVAVPEPSGVALAGLGVIGLAGAALRRRVLARRVAS